MGKKRICAGCGGSVYFVVEEPTISDRRTSQSNCNLVHHFLSLRALFVSRDLSPVIAIRFDFTSFFRTEKEEES